MQKMRLMKTEKRAQIRFSVEKGMSSQRVQRKLIIYSTPASQKLRNFSEDCDRQQQQSRHRFLGHDKSHLHLEVMVVL